MLRKGISSILILLIVSYIAVSAANTPEAAGSQSFIIKGFSSGFYKILNGDKAVCSSVLSNGKESEVFRKSGYEISKALCSKSYLHILAENAEESIIFSILPSGTISASYIPEDYVISDEFTASDSYFYFMSKDKSYVASVKRNTLSVSYNFFSESVSKLFCYNEKAYAVTANALYCLDNPNSAIKCDIPDFDAFEPVFYGNIYADPNGRIYSFSSDGGFKYLRASEYKNIFMLNGAYYALSSKTVYKLSENDTVTAKYTNSENIDSVAVNGNKIALLCSDKVKIISEKDFSAVNSMKNNDSSSSSGSDSNSNSTKTSGWDFSDYTTDGNYIIVPEGTTAAVFKNNVAPSENTSVAFLNSGGSKISSGVLGTGFSASCYEGSSLKGKYTIIVLGDVTGEGSVNTRDKRRLTDFLLGKSELTEAQKYAADFSKDESLDSLDLLYLVRLMKKEQE